MNERQCKEQGLVFSGHTANRYKEEEISKLRERAKQIKKLGFRAIVAKSGTNEWGCGDYILYVEDDYWFYETAKSYQYYVDSEERFIEDVRKRAEQEIAKIREKAAYHRANLEKAEQILAEHSKKGTK